MSEKYYVVAATSELDATGQMHVELNGEEILLCRDGQTYYAIAYLCSHEAFTLEGGSIQQGCITCPYHGAEFNMKTGEAMAAPAYQAIKTYPVMIEENTISIGIIE
jgi:3-phenylpropionate/trans-cinnamate dioxygenase ferredoxin subunit